MRKSVGEVRKISETVRDLEFRAETSEKIAQRLHSDNAALRERLAFLSRAVRGYLDKPGCNAASRQNAFAKLTWAAETVEAFLQGGGE